jgi:hypothetical protein
MTKTTTSTPRLCWIGNVDWFDGSRAAETIQLANVAYGVDLLLQGPTGPGRTVGFTDWTHSDGI